MQTLITYTEYILEACDTLLAKRAHLNQEQREKIMGIQRCARDLVSSTQAQAALSNRHLLKYLQQRALSPVSTMIGYSELMYVGMYGNLPEAERDMVQEICHLSYIVRDVIRDEQVTLARTLQTEQAHT